jgi:hypothetical protein
MKGRALPVVITFGFKPLEAFSLYCSPEIASGLLFIKTYVRFDTIFGSYK